MALTAWLVDKSALVRLPNSPDAQTWADRIGRGLPVECMTPAAERCAVEVQLCLADRGMHRAPPIRDLLIAAVAERSGQTVLHNDKTSTSSPTSPVKPWRPSGSPERRAQRSRGCQPERQHLAADPDGELEELTAIYQQRGLSRGGGWPSRWRVSCTRATSSPRMFGTRQGPRCWSRPLGWCSVVLRRWPSRRGSGSWAGVGGV